MRGLYVIVDEDACRATGQSPHTLARAAVLGGCTVLQLRAKTVSDDSYVAMATPIAAFCRAAGVAFIVNDRAHLVQPLFADGVHVGQGDTPIAKVRRLVGDGLIGLSTHNLEQALAAEQAGADWVALGPIFPTRSKQNAEPEVGLEGLAEVCARLSCPVIAIGGIDVESAPRVLAGGASMIAVISAVSGSPAPEAATRELAALFSSP